MSYVWYFHDKIRYFSPDCAILPESEPEPVIQVINQPLTSVEITPAELVSVTHINSPSLFYIRKVSSHDLLYSLRVLLQRQGLERVGAEEIKLDLEICSNLRHGNMYLFEECPPPPWKSGFPIMLQICSRDCKFKFGKIYHFIGKIR